MAAPPLARWRARELWTVPLLGWQYPTERDGDFRKYHARIKRLCAHDRPRTHPLTLALTHAAQLSSAHSAHNPGTATDHCEKKPWQWAYRLGPLLMDAALSCTAHPQNVDRHVVHARVNCSGCPLKCYLASILNRARFRTGFWGKSESRAWKNAQFLISSSGSTWFPA